MNNYETVMILSGKVDNEARKKAFEKFVKLLNENGKIKKIDELGKKKLAYEVRKENEAYYYVIYFEADRECVAELERQYRITDEVLKFMTIKADD